MDSQLFKNHLNVIRDRPEVELDQCQKVLNFKSNLMHAKD